MMLTSTAQPSPASAPWAGGWAAAATATEYRRDKGDQGPRLSPRTQPQLRATQAASLLGPPCRQCQDVPTTPLTSALWSGWGGRWDQGWKGRREGLIPLLSPLVPTNPERILPDLAPRSSCPPPSSWPLQALAKARASGELPLSPVKPGAIQVRCCHGD